MSEENLTDELRVELQEMVEQQPGFSDACEGQPTGRAEEGFLIIRKNETVRDRGLD